MKIFHKGDLVCSYRNAAGTIFEVVTEHKDGTIAIRAVNQGSGPEVATHFPRELFYLAIDHRPAKIKTFYHLEERLPSDTTHIDDAEEFYNVQ